MYFSVCMKFRITGQLDWQKAGRGMRTAFLTENQCGDFTLNRENDSTRVLSANAGIAASFDTVIFIPQIKKSILLEIDFKQKLKGRFLQDALSAKLETLLPVTLDSIVWGYIPHRSAPGKFLVYAMDRQEFDSGIHRLAAKKQVCDFILPSIMFDSDNTEIRNTYPPRNARALSCAVERNSRPRRNRSLKLLSAFFLVSAIFAFVLFVYGRYLRYDTELTVLRNKRISLSNGLKQLRSEAALLANDLELLNKIRDAKLPETEFTRIFEELTGILPENMWVTSFICNGNNFDVTIYSDKDDLGLYKKLNDVSAWQVLNLNKKRSSSDGGMIFQASLRNRSDQ